MDCSYPQPKKRRRDNRGQQSQRNEFSDFQEYVQVDDLGDSLNFETWSALDTDNFDISLAEMSLPALPALPADGLLLAPSAPGDILECGTVTSCPWFLQKDTWEIDTHQTPHCVVDIDLQPFIHSVDEMLRIWVKTGSNAFIHHRLYEKGMPSCLQDAFITLAAYTTCTAAVKDTILQISEERSCNLLRLGAPTTNGMQVVLDYLARVHALFAYVYIRLFDGSVRLRASAERQVPILRQWVLQLWESARHLQGEGLVFNQNALQLGKSDLHAEFASTSELWKLWILTESVRRTQILVDTTMNTYQAMSKGWAECTGAGMFTARRGMWEVDSPGKWFEMSATVSGVTPPLLVSLLEPDRFMAEFAPKDVDDFAKLCWACIVGPDKMQYWEDKHVTS